MKFTDINSYYLKVDQKEGINSAIECSSLVQMTWSSSIAKGKCNAFRQQGTTCEIGRVSALYGFLEGNFSLPKGTNSGHALSGCSGNCKSLGISQKEEIYLRCKSNEGILKIKNYLEFRRSHCLEGTLIYKMKFLSNR
jgi:hypothetical protein